MAALLTHLLLGHGCSWVCTDRWCPVGRCRCRDLGVRHRVPARVRLFRGDARLRRTGLPARAHLTRLEMSATKLRLPVPDRAVIAGWCRRSRPKPVILSSGCSSRVGPTRSGSGPTHGPWCSRNRPTRDLPPCSFRPERHRGTATETGSSSRAPRRSPTGSTLLPRSPLKQDGFDDALLVGRGGHVLEGPTFSIGWISDGILYTPGLDPRHPRVDHATQPSSRSPSGSGWRYGRASTASTPCLAADEVIAMSTVREVLPVGRVDDHVFSPGNGTQHSSWDSRRS